MDKKRIEAAVRELLAAIGEDPDREGLRETPRRVADMYGEVFSGLEEDPPPASENFQRESARRNGDGAGYPALIPCASTISSLYGCGAYCLHSPGRAGHRAVQAGQDRQQLCLAPAAPGAADRPARGFPRARAQSPGVAVIIEAEHLCMTMRGCARRIPDPDLRSAGGG